MIDLAPEHLQLVRDILSAHVPHSTVWAFGSRVTGRAKSYSDLDLVVRGTTPLTISQLGTLREAFEESTLPFRVDVVDWQSITPIFQGIIAKRYAVVRE